MQIIYKNIAIDVKKGTTIKEFFEEEVKPYVPDAWYIFDPNKQGCEINFNKYFYKPVPLRSLEENEADILALDAESQGFIKSLFE